MAGRLTPEQRVWLKQLGSIMGSPLASAPQLDAQAAPARDPELVTAGLVTRDHRAGGGVTLEPRRPGVTPAGKPTRVLEPGDEVPIDELPAPKDARQVEAFSPADLAGFGGEIIDIIKKLGGGRRICAIQVVNKTSRVIHRGKFTPDGGNFQKLPPDTIKAGDKAEFVASSNEPFPLDIPSSDCGGKLDWLLDLDTTWFIEWSNPIIGSVKSNTGISGVNASKFTAEKLNGNGHTAAFRFTITEAGTGPGPNPQPQPGPDLIASSCLIAVQNNTKAHQLILLEARHERGDFMVRPAKLSLEPNGGNEGGIVSIETPRAPDEGCKGFILYQVGDPPIAKWRIEWDNPEGGKNTATAKIDPPTAPLRSLEVISQGDENVRVNFDLFDAGGGPVDPPETKDDEFAPPPKSKQPTLRVKDANADGWVEYAQRLLKIEPVNGVFDEKMKQVVIDFQKKNKCLPDGVIGNETWSALREGPREAVGTDGRKPHSFEQTDAQARFVKERPDITGYTASDDSYFMQVVSTGEQPIKESFATVKVTQPDGTAHAHKIKIGDVTSPSPDGQGNFHEIKVSQFKRFFGLKPGVDPLTCTVDAYLDGKIGGDRFQGPVTPKN